ncbi:hypothetical protein NLU13_5541 [Sarocladium strictum]|uniref:Uncharacterized protein n=1 Tax=Sarocladium strictum TaxID=5046 RepID=A0AA39L7Q9_SARSR|nr:hypothetical protein NLU13_5541 [Sarocladium strictum]
MLAPALSIKSATMTTPPHGHGYYLDGPAATQLHFKRHKTLPRPHGSSPSNKLPRVRTLDLHDAQRPGSSGSQPSSPRTLKHVNKRIGSGPVLPPTPPTHSRTSSSTHSAVSPSPTGDDEEDVLTPTISVHRVPTTPPDQRSPPTPDVTPPQPKSRPLALRPSLASRGASRSTTADSRTESFKTAREDPFTSEDEDGKSTARPGQGVASGRTSQATVRRSSEGRPRTHPPQPLALSTALASLAGGGDDFYTPRTVGEFTRFDGDWGSPGEVKGEWDDNLQRVVQVKRNTVSKPVPTLVKGPVIEDNLVVPTEATRAARKLSLRESVSTTTPPKLFTDMATVSSGPSRSGTSLSNDARNSSTRSPRSTASTVVEAVLVEAPPQRHRTLRHVRKQTTLRESLSPPADPTRRDTQPSEPRYHAELARSGRSHHESYASNSTANSIASGRARREIRKSGAIPVVVIPDRRSSSKARSPQTPSLRSTSSRRSKRSMSIGSLPVDEQSGKEARPIFERPSRRSRTQSLSDGSERTMDYPPVVPARSSSLSAPTSRNTSRAGSLTAESLRAHNALLHTRKQVDGDSQVVESKQPAEVDQERKSGREHSVSPRMELGLQSLMPPEIEKPERRDVADGEHQDDARSSRRTHPRNTPFSVASFATTGTAPELAEAMAVHMYPHQNSSVVIVHSGRPSEETDAAAGPTPDATPTKPKIQATAPDSEVPITPPQPVFSLEDVDSPLRNPRAPPEPPSHPPTFNLIPATPSGNTPATDKAVQMGNYFEVAGDKPAKRPSLVRRALSKRRHSMSYPPSSSKPTGLITRTLSLSRGSKHLDKTPSPNMERESSYPHEDEKPAEENKLHPFWRPSWYEDEDECDSDCDCRRQENSEGGRYLRYPPVDNRPNRPRRTFSEKMKRTFAILPLENDLYHEDDARGPERRTIRRTPSGNLRVVRQRNSVESLTQPQDGSQRPRTAPDVQSRRSFWRGNSVRRRASKEQLRRRSSLGSRLEEIQNLPRRLSERRREKRTQQLRQKISGPTEVRDGVGEVIRVGQVRLPGEGESRV